MTAPKSKRSGKLLAALLAVLATAVAPLSFGIYEAASVEQSIGAFERTHSDLGKARGAADRLAQTMTGLFASDYDPAGARRARMREETEADIRTIQEAVTALKALGTGALSDEEFTELLRAVTAIQINTRIVLGNSGAEGGMDDKLGNFLHIYRSSSAARRLLQKFETAVAGAAARETADSFERLRGSHRTLLLIMLFGACVSLATLIGIFRSTRRISDANARLEEHEAELSRHSLRFSAALENMSQGLCMFDANRQLTICNQRYATLYGLELDQLKPGASVEAILAMRVAAGASPKDSAAYVSGRLQEASANTSYKIVHELLDGRFIAVSHEPLADGGWVATHEDITEKKRAESKIAHMAHHDALTALPNRIVLGEWLEQKLALEDNAEFAVLCLDLDLFKRVNDTLGHQYGDMLLCQVAERLRGSVRDGDLVARLGGDEFAIVQTGAPQPEAAASLSRRIIEMLNEPFDLSGHQIVIGVSIGVSVAPRDGAKSGDLVKNADLALYRAKADGRNTFRFFERAMDLKMQSRRVLEVDLRKAISDDQLEIMYQPILSVAACAITGFEALLRWNHPTRGRVAPDDFIPLAEEIGLINTIGEWVLRQACAEAATWPAHVKVAVNLSPVQFRGGGLGALVVSALAASGLAASRLELEVTEAVLVHEPESVTGTLNQLRALGVRIAMDDFGTGYSSLSYLQRFPFDKIKIDKGFMRKTSTDADAFAIVKAIISLGKSLGMTITAEGVETEQQFARLAAEKCDEAQGFLFSPARPATEARRLLSVFPGERRKAVA